MKGDLDSAEIKEFDIWFITTVYKLRFSVTLKSCIIFIFPIYIFFIFKFLRFYFLGFFEISLSYFYFKKSILYSFFDDFYDYE